MSAEYITLLQKKADTLKALCNKLGITEMAAEHLAECNACDIIGCSCCADTIHLEYDKGFNFKQLKGENNE